MRLGAKWIPAARIDEFRDARYVQRTRPSAATFPWDDVIPNALRPRAAGCVDQGCFGVVEVIGSRGKHPDGDSQVCRQSISVGQEPGFHRADGHLKAHQGCGCRESCYSKVWGAASLVVKINQDDPRREVGGGVVAANPPPQVRLTSASMHRPESQTAGLGDTRQNGLVGRTLYRGGEDGGGHLRNLSRRTGPAGTPHQALSAA